MQKNTYYITTPIYYVNDVPHIGHAYTSVVVDVIARFKRLDDYDVYFLTGTDEHGQKVEKSAQNAKMLAKDFVDKVHTSFRELNTYMNISNNDFIRTTEPRHYENVQKFWNILLDSGNIYLDKYEGWYSIRDEAFYDESELTQDGKAPTGAMVEWVSQESYFFALSKWQDKLLEFYENNPNFIKPSYRRNEVISFVKSGLRDLSISRTSFSWGVKVPNDDNHVIYVWLDALSNYISALGDISILSNNKKPISDDSNFKYWPAVHVIGKDIIRFHAVYWPAFLMAANIELPKCIFAHGWWMNEGQKISKSLGNVINPIELVNEFGADNLRYFFMREITLGADGNYTRENLIARINSELANKIGNLLQRTVKLLHKYNKGVVPFISNDTFINIYNLDLLKSAKKYNEINSLLIDEFDINSILNNIIDIAEKANLYIDSKAPWKLIGIDNVAVDEILYTLLEAIRYIGIMLQPFTPNIACNILDQLMIDKSCRSFKHLCQEYAIKSGTILEEARVVCLRLE